MESFIVGLGTVQTLKTNSTSSRVVSTIIKPKGGDIRY